MIAETVRRILPATAILFLGLATQAFGASDFAGTWVTDDGLGAVEFGPCGNESCGRIVWLKDPLGKDGKPMRDANNPNAKDQQRPLCGLQIVSSLQKQQDGTWDKGTIYDPDEGKTYSVAIKILPSGDLEVTGYMGSKWLSETMIWKRSTTSQRCTGA